MKFYVTKDIFEKIPDGKFGLVSVTGADNTGNNPEEVLAAREELAELAEKYLGGTVKIGMIDKENVEFDTEL